MGPEVVYVAPPKTYDQVHAGLLWYWGKASEYRCDVCAGTARNWAYLYNTDNQIIDNDGRKYSENFWDYAPMCRSCHRKHDYRLDPELREAHRLGGIKGGKASPIDVAALRERGRRGGQTMKKRFANDAEFRERMSNLTRERMANAPKLVCTTCGLISIRPSMGRHLSSSGHAGFEAVEKE